MKRLAIIGSGDLGQLIAYHAQTDRHYEVAGFFDDYRNSSDKIDGYKVLGKINDVVQSYANGLFDCILIAIGYKHMAIRKEFYEKWQQKIPFGKIIHSSCYIDASCQIGDGCVLLPGCILDRNVSIGENVLINVGATIAHDSKIKNHSFISPRVTVAGFTEIGECCNIGINSTIIDNLFISNNIQTGGGTVVITDLIRAGLYVGNPARFVR